MSHAKLVSIVLLLTTVCARAQPLGRQIEVRPQGEEAKIDTSALMHDLKVLYGTNDTERDALIAKIKENPGDYAPPTFMPLAQVLYLKGDAAGAYFWFCFGRLRGRYDAARCADVSAREGIDVMIMNVDEAIPELRKYPLKMKPDDIVPFAKKVVKLDGDTPYHYDHHWLNLHGMGAFIGDKHELSLPESQWPDLLQKVREDFLKGADEMTAQLKSSTNEPNQLTGPTAKAAAHQ